MEQSTLNVTLDTAIKKAQELNNTLGKINDTTKQTASNNTGMNVSFMSMSQALDNLGSTVPKITSAFQTYKTAQEQVNVASKAFATNPVGATMQIIATVLAVVNAIIDRFKERIAQSDEATQKWNKATAALEPILMAFNKVLDVIVDQFIDMVDVIVKGVEWVGKFADSVSKYFGGSGSAYSDAADKAKKFADLEAEINADTIKRTKERAASEAKQGELREKIAKAEGENKKKLLEDLKNEIKAQTDAEIALNKKRVALMKHQQEQDATSTAEKQALAELEAETDRLIGQQGKELARIEKEIKRTNTSISKHATSTAKSTTDKALEEAKRYAAGLKKILDDSNKAYSDNKTIINAQRKLEDEQLKLYGATEDEILAIKKLRLAQDVIEEEKHYNRLKQLLLKYINDTKLSEKERSNYKKQLQGAELEHKKNKLKQETEATKLAQQDQKKFQRDMEAMFVDMRANMTKNVAENTEELTQRAATARHQFSVDWYNNIEEMRELTQETFAFISEQFDSLTGPQASIINGLGQVTNAFLDMDKNATKVQNAMKVVGAAIRAATSIVNQYMQAKQAQIQQDLESGKISEKEAKKQFEKSKKVQIAMATISMAQGIVEAISKAMSLGAIAGPIIGALNAAAVSAAGIMQIKNIKKTTLESPEAGASGAGEGQTYGSMETYDGGGTAVSPLLDEAFDTAQLSTTTTTTGDSATTDQRVYIVESDIQESNKRVEIREQTTTF